MRGGRRPPTRERPEFRLRASTGRGDSQQSLRMGRLMVDDFEYSKARGLRVHQGQHLPSAPRPASRGDANIAPTCSENASKNSPTAPGQPSSRYFLWDGPSCRRAHHAARSCATTFTRRLSRPTIRLAIDAIHLPITEWRRWPSPPHSTRGVGRAMSATTARPNVLTGSKSNARCAINQYFEPDGCTQRSTVPRCEAWTVISSGSHGPGRGDLILYQFALGQPTPFVVRWIADGSVNTDVSGWSYGKESRPGFQARGQEAPTAISATSCEPSLAENVAMDRGKYLRSVATSHATEVGEGLRCGPALVVRYFSIGRKAVSSSPG